MKTADLADVVDRPVRGKKKFFTLGNAKIQNVFFQWNPHLPGKNLREIGTVQVQLIGNALDSQILPIKVFHNSDCMLYMIFRILTAPFSIRFPESSIKGPTFERIRRKRLLV